MITLVFLKALCDLGIYYTFAGFFAVLLGAAPALLLAALPLQALCFAAAFPLRRGRLRYLPWRRCSCAGSCRGWGWRRP